MSGPKTVFVRGYEASTWTLTVPSITQTSVKQFKAIMKEKHGELVPDDIRMFFAGKEMREKSADGEVMMLSEYNLQDKSTVQIVIRVPGGMPVTHNTTTDEKEYDQSDFSIEFTDDPDAITGEYDPKTKRAKMSCGHAVAPNSLTAWCRSLVDQGKTELRCPALVGTEITTCKKEWPYWEVRKLALLNDDEMEFFESKLSELAAKTVVDLKECPSCRSFLERKCTSNLRVICTVCRAKNAECEFCWNCDQPWCGPMFASDACGNPGCEHPDLASVRDCVKIISASGITGIPSRRACPTCGCVIEHKGEGGCKIVSCHRCQKEFCFSCLKLKAACFKSSGFFRKCASGVAPKQTKIPTWDREKSASISGDSCVLL